jgi:hypothetical protein
MLAPNRPDHRTPVITVLMLLSTCVSVSPSTTGPPPPPPPPPPPNGPFADFTDPEAATNAVATLEGAFAAPVLQSLSAFAPMLSIFGGHAPVPVSPTGAPTCSGGATPAIPAGGVFPGALAAIPDSALTGVFTYDSATRAFRRSADSGGPANGVRFLLAQVDSKSLPVFPLATVGWLDVTDRSGPGGPDSLHAVLVGQGMPLVDYVMAPVGTSASYREKLAGSFTGGGYTFGFRDSTTRLGSQVTAAAIVDDTTHDLHMTLTATRTAADRFDNFYTVDFGFTFGAETVRLQGSLDVYCLIPSTGLTVRVNDSTFASVTNGVSPYAPDITRADGKPTTAAQSAAVMDLIRVQGELFHWLETFSLPGSLMLGP